MSTPSELCRCNSNNHVPRPSEPTTSAMMLAVMNTFRACRPTRFRPVPHNRMTKAMLARWVPLGASIPAMLAMNPAAPSATVAIAMTSVQV